MSDLPIHKKRVLKLNVSDFLLNTMFITHWQIVTLLQMSLLASVDLTLNWIPNCISDTKLKFSSRVCIKTDNQYNVHFEGNA